MSDNADISDHFHVCFDSGRLRILRPNRLELVLRRLTSSTRIPSPNYQPMAAIAAFQPHFFLIYSISLLSNID